MHRLITPPPGFEGRPAREWPVPPMDHSAGGKESAYTPQMGRVILGRLEDGETVKAICADPAMPAYCTVYQWRRVDPDFAELWTRVRRARARDAVLEAQQRRVEALARREAEIAIGLRRRRNGGRRGSYTQETGRKVCAAVAAGAALYRVVARPDMPSARVVYGWLRTRAAFRRMYVEACEARARTLKIAIDMQVDRLIDAPPSRALLADARRSVARLEGRIGRLTPKTYRAGLGV